MTSFRTPNLGCLTRRKNPSPRNGSAFGRRLPATRTLGEWEALTGKVWMRTRGRDPVYFYAEKSWAQLRGEKLRGNQRLGIKSLRGLVELVSAAAGWLKLELRLPDRQGTRQTTLPFCPPRACFPNSVPLCLLRNWGPRPPRALRRTPSCAAASSEARAWGVSFFISPRRGSLLRGQNAPTCFSSLPAFLIQPDLF